VPGVAAKAAATVPEPSRGHLFFCEECIVHGGQRSQRIKLERPSRAGIYQVVGANPGWDYQISVWYVINERTQGLARLGIDPAGGDDPEAPGIVWASGAERQRWAQLTVRATAAERAVTIFLEMEGGEKGPVDGCFDDVELVPVQPFCPEKEEERPDEPPREEIVCVNFTDLKPGTRIEPVYEKDGFCFGLPQGHELFHVIASGDPIGQSKLLTAAMGISVKLPFPSDWVSVRLTILGGQPPSVKALDRDGNVVGQAEGTTAHNKLQTLEITAPGIVALHIEGRGREGLLYEVCARRDWRKEKEPHREKEQDDRGFVAPQPPGGFDLKANLARSLARVENNIRLAGINRRAGESGSKD
jgi:hypothetical protein